VEAGQDGESKRGAQRDGIDVGWNRGQTRGREGGLHRINGASTYAHFRVVIIVLTLVYPNCPMKFQ
jgi:hypothetical protein